MVFCNVEIHFENLTKTDSHNPYFNRWFSAMYIRKIKDDILWSHNPYFNRWFSAIVRKYKTENEIEASQSLF